MNSKEEILKKATAKKYDMSANSTNSFTDDLLVAMDEYAKQECIAFAEWLPFNAVIAQDGYHYLSLENLQPITVPELHEQFLQSKNK